MPMENPAPKRMAVARRRRRVSGLLQMMRREVSQVEREDVIEEVRVVKDAVMEEGEEREDKEGRREFDEDSEKEEEEEDGISYLGSLTSTPVSNAMRAPTAPMTPTVPLHPTEASRRIEREARPPPRYTPPAKIPFIRPTYAGGKESEIRV